MCINMASIGNTADAKAAKEPARTEHDRAREWVPEQALAVLRLHTKLVHLLVEKVDLPFSNLQELRLACQGRGASSAGNASCRAGQTSPFERWVISAGGGLCQTQELRCPLWHRLWVCAERFVGQELLSARGPRTQCQSRQEMEIVDEVEVHVSAALRHLGHASSHRYEVGAHFSNQLAQKDDNQAICIEDASTAGGDTVLTDGFGELPSSPQVSVAPYDVAADAGNDGLGLAFGQCQDLLCEAVWAFFLKVQILSAILHGDVLLLAAWAVRLLGLAGPWSLRRLQEFVLHALELLADHPCGLSAAEERRPALQLLFDACATYLTAPVIPRLQARLQKCAASLREKGILRPEEGSEKFRESLATLLGEGDKPLANFDPTGDALAGIRKQDSLFLTFQRTYREAVIGRLDRSCTMELRQRALRSLEALSAAPLVRAAAPSWPLSRKRQLLLEATASMPQRLHHKPAETSQLPKATMRKSASTESLDDVVVPGLSPTQPRLGMERIRDTTDERSLGPLPFSYCCSTDLRF
eukprot:TRINITY_DN6670_c0_g1_i2.p1 TRINITY_DN6670_c0_g1~~TRINITY_DN6670_c0_g1_i2.p1  ORF type:complete len:528 (-),score=94.43 TRINITY_DN6670_c0_g1_i2:188-1771(-)